MFSLDIGEEREVWQNFGGEKKRTEESLCRGMKDQDRQRTRLGLRHLCISGKQNPVEFPWWEGGLLYRSKRRSASSND